MKGKHISINEESTGYHWVIIYTYCEFVCILCSNATESLLTMKKIPPRNSTIVISKIFSYILGQNNNYIDKFYKDFSIIRKWTNINKLKNTASKG